MKTAADGQLVNIPALSNKFMAGRSLVYRAHYGFDVCSIRTGVGKSAPRSLMSIVQVSQKSLFARIEKFDKAGFPEKRLNYY